MVQKLYAWDEISNMITEWDPHELFDMNRDGGWESGGWISKEGIPDDGGTNLTDIKVVTTGRHIGLETWAESYADAEAKFATTKIWKDCNTEE
jgi:hypothetical protein